MAASNETTDEILKAGSSHVTDSTVEIKLENLNDCDTVEIQLGTKCRGCFTEESEMHYLYSVIDQKLSLADILTQTTSYLVSWFEVIFILYE